MTNSSIAAGANPQGQHDTGVGHAIPQIGQFVTPAS
jgi:hypothetical protein